MKQAASRWADSPMNPKNAAPDEHAAAAPSEASTPITDGSSAPSVCDALDDSGVGEDEEGVEEVEEEMPDGRRWSWLWLPRLKG